MSENILPTSHLEKAVREQSEAPTPAGHDMAERSVELTLLCLLAAVHGHSAPAQDMKVISERRRGPAGVILSNTSLVARQVRGSE